MEDNSMHSPKKITSKHVLRADIEIVWELLNNPEFLFKDLMGDVVTSYESNHDKQNKLGAETILHFKDYSLKSICHSLFEETNYKQIKKLKETYMDNCSEKHVNFEIQNTTYTLISNALEGSTTFVWDIEFEHPEFMQMTSEAIEKYKQNRFVFIKKFEEHLAKIPQCSQSESIIVDSERNEVWDVITNWSVLITISPIIADEIEFDGDQLKLGSHVALIYRAKRKFISNFRVLNVSNKNDGSDWEYRLKLVDSYPKIPYQEIRFKIALVSGNNCQLTFQHLYTKKLDIKMLNDVSNDKKIILQGIKNYLEK